MKRTRTSLVRHIVIWAAKVVLVVSVVAWSVGPARVYWFSPHSNRCFALGYGAASSTFGVDKFFSPPGWHVLGWDGWTQQWLPRCREGHWGIPLWMPAVAAGLVLALAWLVGRKARRWRRAGFCSTCGYDWRVATGPCPECGKEREA